MHECKNSNKPDTLTTTTAATLAKHCGENALLNNISKIECRNLILMKIIRLSSLLYGNLIEDLYSNSLDANQAYTEQITSTIFKLFNDKNTTNG